ncbi:cutinase family protein [Salinibacterium sp. SYSU T00001]|uniref:cutinase family protein n=1 Tax=Homoserinimonas sedimenticola TaxID=2986805 RepID=UPI0022361871|nr:cutinase family protein [Salinibacterium sedimenticola]MCW4385832.1 cutinase family protein [Salinibacterium sedimenticola]
MFELATLRGVAACIVAATGLCAGTAATTLASASPSCEDVRIVFARGSGQALGDDEYERFVEGIEGRLSADIKATSYELGRGAHGGSKYPAVSVEPADTALGAILSGGSAYAYGDSVKAGVKELNAYLEAELESCPETLFVLGGYSQGAQVVGDMYAAASDDVRRAIVFNGLFGDPKLNLPEGRHGCRGYFSEWRRVIGGCDTLRGSLGARVPYVPTASAEETGLWCNDDDFICGTGALGDISGHLTYADDGAAIDMAALEAASRLQYFLRASFRPHDVNLSPLNIGTAGIDVAFVVDSRREMEGELYDSSFVLESVAADVRAHNGRAAVIEYRGAMTRCLRSAAASHETLKPQLARLPRSNLATDGQKSTAPKKRWVHCRPQSTGSTGGRALRRRSF